MSVPSPAIEQAHSITVGSCPCGNCDLVVGYLRDEAGDVFAAFSFTPQGARIHVANVEAAIEAIAPAGPLTGIRCEGTA